MHACFRGPIAFLFLLLSIGITRGNDWPTYLHDAQRAGSTPEQLKLPLQAGWQYSSPVPPPRAWSGPTGRTVEGKVLKDRVRFDDAFQVAVVGDRLYFGSSVDHQLHCVDARTGESQWSFFTGGSIRLAPTVADGRVFIGSDDGYAYCLDAADGRLIWKLRLGPAEEWIIGRGEMMSRWPVRTGILVQNGIAYFGAGVFPHENVYMAAVHAKDGKVIWKNNHISHSDAGRNDLSPQGYLLASKTRIYIPSARSRPWSLDPKTGKVSSGGASSLKLSQTAVAGTDALVANGRLRTYSLGTRLAVSGDIFIATTGADILRLEAPKFLAANSKRGKLESDLRNLYRAYRRKQVKEEEYKAKSAVLRKQLAELKDVGVAWRAKNAAEGSLIIAGNHVYAGGQDKVTVYDLMTGKPVWQTKVEGEARGLAVAGGKLIVSTTAGKIYCFHDASATVPKPAGKVIAREPFTRDALTPVYEKAAQDILKTSAIHRGYCLVLGNEQGRLAYELAKRSKLKIYALEPDQAKVAAARKSLSAARVYGNRITVHQADLNHIPYSSYFANLIVSDAMLQTGKLPAQAAEVIHHLKPAGGKIIWGSRKAKIQEVVSLLEKSGLEKQATVAQAGAWAVLTRGTLAGAGNWSHQYAEPGNTANSGDKLVKGGLGVLWYGDPGPGMMVNRHQGAVGPIVVNGRMFIQGTDSLLAYDAYNGLFLWEQKNPEAVRTGVFQNRAPGNLAAGGDRLFHMVRTKVYAHDMATGRVRAIYELPAKVNRKTHEWGYIAYRNGIIYGTATTRAVIDRDKRRRGNPGVDATDAVFAIDVESGKHLWTYQGKSISHHTIAIGPDRVYFIDSSITSAQRAAILKEDKKELKKLTGEEAKRAEARLKKLDVRLAVAVDARSGKKLWAKPVDVTDCSDIGIGGGKLTLIYTNDTLILCGANANGHYWRQFIAGEFKRRRLVALSAEHGYKLWAKDANYRHRPIIVGDKVIAEPWAFDLFTGKQLTRKHPITGKQVSWSMVRPGHHCGMLTACPNMLLFRSGFTGFYDLTSDSGTRHFAGHRLGCWINAIPTNGLVVIPEASAGCVCMFSIASTIELEPRKPRRPWTIYSGVGATTPVQQMHLNFGAPGDRRDAKGKLWLAYPRPAPKKVTSLDLAFKLQTQFAPSGGFFTVDGDASEQKGPGAWLNASGARGLIKCTVPLLGKGDAPANYTVKLHFAVNETSTAKPGMFDVVIQGKKVLADVAVLKSGIQVKEIDNIKVAKDLVIEMVSQGGKLSSAKLPVLNAIELTKE